MMLSEWDRFGIAKPEGIQIEWDSSSEEELKSMLEDAGVKIRQGKHLPEPVNKCVDPGAVVSDAAPFAVQIITAISGLGVSSVLIAWLKQKAGRNITIKKHDKSINITASGYSTDDLNKILDGAEQIIATQKN